MADVSRISIGGELEAFAVCPGFQFFHERKALVGCPLSDKMIDDELGWPVHAQIAVKLAPVEVASFDKLRTPGNVGIKLVHLDTGCFDAADMLTQKPLAMLASGIQDAQNGMVAKAGQPGNGVDADALKQHGNDLRGLLGFNPHALQRLFFAESGVTAQTAESLDAMITVLIKARFLDWPGTTMASHFGLAFLDGLGYRDSESYRILSEGFGLWICSADASNIRRALFLPLKI
jgi:hypothetical protein